MFNIAENRSFQYSTALHVAALVVMLVGFPSLFTNDEPQPSVMTVEILPIGATNIKPSDQPIQKKQVAKQPVKQPPKPVQQTQKSAPAAPKEAEPIPDKKTPPPKEEKKQDVKKDAPKTDAKQQSDFEKMMEDMRKASEESKKSDPKATDSVTKEENKSKSNAPYDPTKPLSISALDAIRSQFIPCWTPPVGALDAANLKIIILVRLSQSGEVTEAHFHSSQSGRYNSDTFFRAAADSAMRAVHKCSPLKNLPSEEYSSWSYLELVFDPSDLI